MNNYDEDGFYILRPKIQMEYPIGECRIVEDTVVFPTTTKPVAGASVNINRHYKINYAAKSWQNKAWKSVCNDINWSTGTKFSAIKDGSEKLRHVKAIALSVKVLLEGGGMDSIVIERLEGSSKNSSMYLLITTPAELKRALNWIHTVMYDNLDKYIKMGKHGGYKRIKYVEKVLIIYDDMTFDHSCGDPRNLQIILGLKFDDKGKVIL